MSSFGYNNDFHEQKLWALTNTSQQLIGKTCELSFMVERMMTYGLNDIEPWRREVSSLVDCILDGSRSLENTMITTLEDCRELDRRVNVLAEEILNLKAENEAMRMEVERIASHEKNKSEFRDRIEEKATIDHQSEMWFQKLGEARELLEEKIEKLQEMTRAELLELYKRVSNVEDSIKGHTAPMAEGKIKSSQSQRTRRVEKREKEKTEKMMQKGAQGNLEVITKIPEKENGDNPHKKPVLYVAHTREGKVYYDSSNVPRNLGSTEDDKEVKHSNPNQEYKYKSSYEQKATTRKEHYGYKRSRKRERKWWSDYPKGSHHDYCYYPRDRYNDGWNAYCNQSRRDWYFPTGERH